VRERERSESWLAARVFVSDEEKGKILFIFITSKS
jgi:hypothetical protein